MVLDGGRLHESEQDLAVFGIQRCQIRTGAPQSTNEAHSGHGVAVQTVRMNRYCKMWDLAYMYTYIYIYRHLANLYMWKDRKWTDIVNCGISHIAHVYIATSPKFLYVKIADISPRFVYATVVWLVYPLSDRVGLCYVLFRL